MSDPINQQYEAYPYPSRDPADEEKRLVQGSPSDIAEIGHYLFAGKRDWSKPFRALFAGGGTGDGLIQCAQQLAEARCPAEIIYLDLSRASREIAQSRAQRRGLENIRFETDTLLNAEAYGRFDYIDCCGVLHHLEDPPAGFSALSGALAAGGGMGLMVYGGLGRTGVHEAQNLLRILNRQAPLEAQIKTAEHFLDVLPETNWLNRNSGVGDHKTGPAGIVDLLLHGRDRAYSVDEFHDALDHAGLAVVSFIEAARYRPEFYFSDPLLLEKLAPLSARQQAAFAEQLAGNLKVHIAYVSRAGESAGRMAKPGPHMVPVPHRIDMTSLADAVKSGQSIGLTFDGLATSLKLPQSAHPLIALIDGERSLNDIMRRLGESDWIQFARRFDETYGPLNGINKLLLRSRS